MVERPYTLVAELTYRCPLACPYCSNPVEHDSRSDLDGATWRRIFREAETLGVVQVNLTGGEPLLRGDLEALVSEARDLDLYVNLITSGTPVTRDRLARLRDCGLDSVQLSLQGAHREAADRLAGMPTHDRKLAMARWVGELTMPLTLNVVLHRNNLHDVPDVIRLAEELHVDRLELANTQYLGWALANRAGLLPTREQLENARIVVEAARTRLRGTMEILFVMPDYYADVPRTCMDGWGRRFIVVSPEGMVLPCHAAHTIPGLPIERASQRSLQDIWERSDLFNRFRGDSWMPSPCRTCERRWIDYGGCRCQAYHLTGSASSTDPACHLSPDHAVILSAREQAGRTGEPTLFQPRLLRLPS